MMPVPVLLVVSVHLKRSEDPVVAPKVKVVVLLAIVSARFPLGLVSADHAVLPPPDPQTLPVPLTTPEVFTCKHCVDPVMPLRVSPESVWMALHVFAWPNAIDATTAPVVGVIVRVPSLLDTADTAPPPDGACQFAALVEVAVRTFPMAGVPVTVIPLILEAFSTPDPEKLSVAPDPTFIVAVVLDPDVIALNAAPPPPPVPQGAPASINPFPVPFTSTQSFAVRDPVYRLIVPVKRGIV